MPKTRWNSFLDFTLVGSAKGVLSTENSSRPYSIRCNAYFESTDLLFFRAQYSVVVPFRHETT